MGSNSEKSGKSIFQSLIVSANVNKRFHGLILGAIAAAFLLGYFSASLSSSSSSSSSSFRGMVLYKGSDESDLSIECKTKLNALDNVYNQRRKVRQTLVQQAQAEGKNVYEKYWKINVKDDHTKEKEAKNRKAMLFDMWEPEAVCLTEERFGGNSDERFNAFGDGPKFICGVDYVHEQYTNNNKKKNDNNNNKCLVYSIGSNNNIMFEKAVHQHMGCEIHTFDPTLSSPFRGSAYSNFHPWGLGVDGEEVFFEARNSTFTTYSLEHIMKELGHVHRKIDVFKIDCERCEYSAMPPVFDAIAAGKLQIDQILIELHSMSYETITSFFEGVDKAGFRIIHKERNGWGCAGVGCIEYAFVSPSYLRRATAAAIC